METNIQELLGLDEITKTVMNTENKKDQGLSLRHGNIMKFEKRKEP